MTLLAPGRWCRVAHEWSADLPSGRHYPQEVVCVTQAAGTLAGLHGEVIEDDEVWPRLMLAYEGWQLEARPSLRWDNVQALVDLELADQVDGEPSPGGVLYCQGWARGWGHCWVMWWDPDEQEWVTHERGDGRRSRRWPHWAAICEHYPRGVRCCRLRRPPRRTR